MTGVNRNVEGKTARKIMRFSGGHPAFRAALRRRRGEPATAIWRWPSIRNPKFTALEMSSSCEKPKATKQSRAEEFLPREIASLCSQ